MKRVGITGLRPQVLAIVVWATAGVAGAFAFVLGRSAEAQSGQWLAVAASIAFAYVGYLFYVDKDDQPRTRWQSAVWLGTFLLVAFFLIRALLRQAV
jgi:hypothetical protein